MAFYSNRNGNRSFGLYEPKQPGQFLAMSSHDRVKQRMIDLKHEVEDNISEMIGYKMLGKIPVMVEEKCQASILKLFITCRPHIKNFIRKSTEKALARKKEKDREIILKQVSYFQKNYDMIDSAYNQMRRGSKISDENIYEISNFLGQFIYDVGVSRIELPETDPLKEYSMAAYGEDFSEDLDDDGNNKETIEDGL